MMQQYTFLFLLVLIVPAVAIESKNIRSASSEERRAWMLEDPFFDDDVCLNGYGSQGEPIYGKCDTSKFPSCQGEETLCYNRRPRRDKFHPDILMPFYYIDYRSVLCYPQDFEGCSSCSPGRYCESESRCIRDDMNYPCAKWI